MNPEASLREPDRRQQIAVKNGSSVVLLDTDQIRWIEADRDYVRIHAAEGSYRIRATMKELEAELDPREFVRIHRSTIVNRWAVSEIVRESEGRWVAVLDDGASRGISNRGMQRLEAVLEVTL